MKTFLSKNKKPICKWGNIPNEVYYEGKIPEGYNLCINPHYPYCIIDIDNKQSGKNGFTNIPKKLLLELDTHYNYNTPSGGKHIWILYLGDKILPNKTSNLAIDLRTDKGYVCYYPAHQGDDIRNHLDEIKESSPELNEFLENLFCYVNKK
jgi:hypothetical protein